MRRAKRTLVILSLALAGCRGPVLSPTATPHAVTVHLLATTSTYPLLQDFASAYRPANTLLAVERSAAGWESVYALLRAGDAPFALTTVQPPDAAWWAAQVGWDGLAIVVHTTNDVPELTLDDLRRVFQGRVESWAEFGGLDVPVTVVSQEAGAEARQLFELAVMGWARITPAARLALSSASVVDIVGSVPGAVGFVSMAHLDERVRAVALRVPGRDLPVLPSPEAVTSGDYPLRAPVLVVGPQPPLDGSVYWDWFAWMQSAPGQQVVGQYYGVLAPKHAPAGEYNAR